MGDMADFTNETGLEQCFYEQDILDRGDQVEMYEAGLCDEQGGIDLGNPPGLIGFMKKHYNVSEGSSCPKCGKKIVGRTNKKTKIKFLGCSGFPVCRFSQ